MASYDKKGWKRQIKATLLGNIAGDLATSLIKSPFEEPRQRFLIHDQAGRELDRQYKGLATEQAKNAVTRQTIQGSKLEDLAWFQKKNFDAMKAQLGEQYQDYEKDVFVQNGMGALREEANRLGQIEHDEFIASENKLRLLPDRDTFNARVDRYTPRSKNWGQALFRAGKRFVKKQSYEEYADNSIRSIVDGTGIDFTDEEITEIRKLGLQARRPVNKEGVLDAVKAVLNIDEVKVGMEQAQRQQRHGLAIVADRLSLQDQKLNGTMDPTFMRAYDTLDAKRLGADKTTAPTTTEVMALMRKNFKDSFIADDSVTRDNMINEWKGRPEVPAYQAKMYDSLAIWKTQDESAEGGYTFDNLKNKDDVDAVIESANEVYDRVYSVARDRTLVQLQRAYDEGVIPRDYLGGTPSARMLQKQMIFKNANAILLGGLEKGEGKDVVVNQRTGWWDTTEAREYLTGAIIAPTSEEFILGVMDQINKVGAKANEHMPAMTDASKIQDALEEHADLELATATTDTIATTKLSEEAEKLLASVRTEKDKRYFSRAERERQENRLRVDGLKIIASAATSFSKNNPDAHPDEQWEATQGRIKGLSEELAVNFGSTPSSEGGGLSQEMKEGSSFIMSGSPFINTDVTDVFRAEKPDEEFGVLVKKDGSVDINFQGTNTRKPSDWSISKLTPNNTINIDNITNMNVYNHLRHMAEEYHGASKDDRSHIIDKVDFEYGEEDTGEIVLWEDVALVKELFSQFNERYIKSYTQDLEDEDEDKQRLTSLLAPIASGVIPL